MILLLLTMAACMAGRVTDAAIFIAAGLLIWTRE
jgi:hypothetical protein